MTKFCTKCGCVVDDESQDYCMACMEEIQNTPMEYRGYVKPNTKFENTNITRESYPTHEFPTNWGKWLVATLQILAWLELIAGGILAFACGIDNSGYFPEFNAFIFFICLVGGIIGFVIFQALAVCVKAANKYLNN